MAELNHIFRNFSKRDLSKRKPRRWCVAYISAKLRVSLLTWRRFSVWDLLAEVTGELKPRILLLRMKTNTHLKQYTSFMLSEFAKDTHVAEATDADVYSVGLGKLRWWQRKTNPPVKDFDLEFYRLQRT
eukprot:TsM_000338000 transcript=TsM_000338000 gene=TsM_000338000